LEVLFSKLAEAIVIVFDGGGVIGAISLAFSGIKNVILTSEEVTPEESEEDRGSHNGADSDGGFHVAP
jgi:hypothetical protein